MRGPNRHLDHGSIALIEPAAQDGNEIDRVRDGRALPLRRFRRQALEDVQGVPGSQRQSDVLAADRSRQPPVLVFGVEHEHLHTRRERGQRKRRHEVRLPGPGMAEHADVRVGVPTVVERVDDDRGAG